MIRGFARLSRSFPARPASDGAVDFITNVLQSSTEYSIVSKVNSSILHVPEDVKAGKHREIMQAALRDGKWEGTLQRLRKNGQRFTARVVITPRRDGSGKAIGFLLISKDISDEIRLTEQLKATQLYTRSLIESNIAS